MHLNRYRPFIFKNSTSIKGQGWGLGSCVAVCLIRTPLKVSGSSETEDWRFMVNDPNRNVYHATVKITHEDEDRIEALDLAGLVHHSKEIHYSVLPLTLEAWHSIGENLIEYPELLKKTYTNNELASYYYDEYEEDAVDEWLRKEIKEHPYLKPPPA